MSGAFRLPLIGALALAVGLMTLLASPAQSQTCLTVNSSCESDAEVTLQRCARSCARYDNACSDDCDDTHDIVVRHCWIMKELCKRPDWAQRAQSITIKGATGH